MQADHKKTFFYLEQLILKHRAHSNTVNIKPMAGESCCVSSVLKDNTAMHAGTHALSQSVVRVFIFILVCSPDGLDFYFVKQDDGRKLVDFLSAVVPCK